MVKLTAFIFGLIMLSSAALAQGRLDNPAGTASVSVDISSDDTKPPATSLQVALFTTGDSQVSTVYTANQSTAVFNGIRSGNYQVRVTGAEIEETTARFTVLPRQSFVLVTVRVKRKATAADRSSRDGAVSTATLNIPEKARQEFEKGMHAMNETKWDDADKHFSKAIDQYPNYAAAWNARGVVFMRSQKAPDAHSAFEKAIAADGQFSSAYVNLAKLLILEKKNAEAETLLGKAISLNPRDPNALAVLANLDLTTGRLDEAIARAYSSPW